MVLNAHAGTKYGVPFPVLARSSFGVRGANVPSLLRALVACGWFGIQTWVGAGAIHTLLNGLSGGALTAPAVAWLGISLPELGCFLLFWAAQVAIIVRGIESIKVVERYSAPVLIGLTMALFGWRRQGRPLLGGHAACGDCQCWLLGHAVAEHAGL